MANLRTLASKTSEDWSRLQNRAQAELARRTRSLYDWSLAHRFLDGTPMELIPALEAIYKDDHPFLVTQKPAQAFAAKLVS